VKYPLTLRGTLALITGVYLFLGPAQYAADLVAGLLGLTLIVVGILLSVIAIIFGLIFKRKLKPTVHSPQESKQGEQVSGQPIKIVINVGKLSVPSLFLLKLKLVFEKSDLTPSTHELIGQAKKDRLLVEEITFPHRGNWIVTNIQATFTDRFGLTTISWNMPLSDMAIRIAPSGDTNSYIPIISSSQRAGDELEHPLERTGDPYDLKPYHPSDSMRKILWKVFARSGELISRHPEKSMTPEGKVVIFVLADRHDDQTCQMALQYIERLQSLSLEVWAGCSGISKSSLDLGRDLNSTKELLIDTAWDSNWAQREGETSNTETDLEYLLASLPQNSSQLSSMLIFASRTAISSDDAVKSLSNIGSYLSSIGIEPIFCIEASKDTLQDTNSPILASALASSPRLRAFFLGEKLDPRQEAIKYYPNFIKICAQTNWQVII